MVDEFTATVLPIISVVVIIVGIVVGWIWQSILRKDRRRMDMQVSAADVEKAAVEKRKEEQALAKDLKEHNEKVALDVKQNMKDHISQLISTLKQDIELQRSIIYSKIDLVDIKVQQTKIDLVEHIKNYTSLEQRMTRSIEFLQTMAWGPDAKSVPHYMMGEEETEEHKEEAGKGVFRDRTKEEQEEIDKKKTD